MVNSTILYITMSILITAFIFAYIDNKRIDRERNAMQKEIIEALKKQNEALRKLRDKIKEQS
jgi:uncharacterized membrane protein (DUF106 family)